MYKGAPIAFNTWHDDRLDSVEVECDLQSRGLSWLRKLWMCFLCILSDDGVIADRDCIIMFHV